MANEQLLDELADIPALTAQGDALSAILKRLADQYDTLATKSASIGGFTNSKEMAAQIKSLQDQISALQKAKTDLLNTDIKALKQAQEEAKVRQQNAKALEAETKANDAVTKSKTAAAKASQANVNASQKEQKAIEDLSNDYKQLSIAYNEAALKAKNLALQQGSNTAAAKAAAADAAALGAKLKEVDASVGQYQRNVGNYTNAFSKAFGALRTAANILPGYGLSGVILLIVDSIEKLGQAIFNTGPKIGTLEDNLSKTADSIAGTKSKFEGAASAVSELNDYVQLAKDGFLKKDEVVKYYNETIGKTIGKVSDLGELEKKLAESGQAYIQFTLLKAAAQVAAGKAAEQAFLAEQARQKRALEFQTIGTNASVFGKGQVTAPGFVPGIDPTAAFKAQAKAAEDARAKTIKDATDQKDSLLAIEKKFNDDAAALAKQFGFKFFDFDDKGGGGSDTKLKTFLSKESDELEKYYIELEKTLSNAVDVGAATRLAARKQEYADELALAIKDRDAKLAVENAKLNDVISNPKSKNNERINAQREFDANMLTINNEFNEKQIVQELKFQTDLDNIKNTSRAKQIADDKAANDLAEAQFKAEADARLKKYQDGLKERDAIAKRNYDDQSLSNQRLYADGFISYKEYKDKQLLLDQQYSIQSQSNLIKDAEYAIAHYKELGANVAEQEQKIADIKKKISDDVTQHLLDNEQKRIDMEKEAAKQVGAAVKELVGDYYDKEKNAIQDQINALQAKTQAEINAVNLSVASEQDKAAQIAIINAKADAQQQQLEKRQKDADVKKAEFDKAISIVQIGANTYTSVQDLNVKAAQARAQAALLASDPKTAAFAGAAFASAASISAQIPIVIAQGVIAAALVAARPIPKYKTGTENHPGGFFIGGDGGKNEFVLLPSGEGFVTANKDTMYNAPKGTKVFPDANNLPDDVMKLANRPLRPMPTVGNDNTMVAMLSAKIGRLERAIINKQETHFNWSNGELQKAIKKGNDFIRWKNRL